MTNNVAAKPTSSVAGGLREAFCIAILCSAMLLTQSGLAQTIFPLSYISNSFNIQSNPGQQSWITAAYSLTVGTFVLPSGRLGDMYGHRFMVQIGFAWFAVWEMVAGLLGQYSKNIVGFDIVRGLIGIGPSILLPNAIAILGRINAPGTLMKMISFCAYAATAPNGAILGGVFSVLLARNPALGWYWSFYIFAIVLAVLFASTWFLVPSDAQIEQRVIAWSKKDVEQQNPNHTPKRSFDFLGTLTGVTGLVLFNFAFNQAIVVGWQEPYVYALLIVGIVFMVAFVIVESKVRDPLVPLEAFQLRTSLVLACIAFGWSSFGIWFFYSIRFLQELRFEQPLTTVAQFVPCGISGIIAAFSSVFLLQRIRPGYVMLGAMMAFCAGNALVATMPVGQTYWIQMFLAVIITPFGMDMSFPSASIIVSDALPPEKQGMAGSLVNTIVNYSIAFGLGLAGTVEIRTNRANTDIERGFRGALYLGIGLAALGIICAVGLLLVSSTNSDKSSQLEKQEQPKQHQLEEQDRQHSQDTEPQSSVAAA